jgi:hypothetical protein
MTGLQDAILRRGHYSFRILELNISVGMVPGLVDAINADVFIELILARSHSGDPFFVKMRGASIRGPMSAFRKTQEGVNSVGELSLNVQTETIVVELMASSECFAYLQRLRIPEPHESLVLTLTTDYKINSFHFKKENSMAVLDWHLTHYSGALPLRTSGPPPTIS